MKFLVLIKAPVPFDEAVIREITRFHDEMSRAGVLLDAGGLWPSPDGTRIRGPREAPVGLAGDPIAGYRLVQARSFDDVVEWMTRCPTLQAGGTALEIRRLLEDGQPVTGGRRSPSLSV